jgi:hypothetical protein
VDPLWIDSTLKQDRTGPSLNWFYSKTEQEWGPLFINYIQGQGRNVSSLNWFYFKTGQDWALSKLILLWNRTGFGPSLNWFYSIELSGLSSPWASNYVTKLAGNTGNNPISFSNYGPESPLFNRVPFFVTLFIYRGIKSFFSIKDIWNKIVFYSFVPTNKA